MSVETTIIDSTGHVLPDGATSVRLRSWRDYRNEFQRSERAEKIAAERIIWRQRRGTGFKIVSWLSTAVLLASSFSMLGVVSTQQRERLCWGFPVQSWQDADSIINFYEPNPNEQQILSAISGNQNALEDNLAYHVIQGNVRQTAMLLSVSERDYKAKALVLSDVLKRRASKVTGQTRDCLIQTSEVLAKAGSTLL